MKSIQNFPGSIKRKGKKEKIREERKGKGGRKKERKGPAGVAQ